MEGSGSACAAERRAGHKARGWAEALDQGRGNEFEASLVFLPSSPLNLPLWHRVNRCST